MSLTFSWSSRHARHRFNASQPPCRQAALIWKGKKMPVCQLAKKSRVDGSCVGSWYDSICLDAHLQFGLLTLVIRATALKMESYPTNRHRRDDCELLLFLFALEHFKTDEGIQGQVPLKNRRNFSAQTALGSAAAADNCSLNCLACCFTVG